MKKRNGLKNVWKNLWAIVFLLLLAGCGGGEGDGLSIDPISGNAEAFGGVIVDPYITDAILVETSPAGTILQESSKSDARGRFIFRSAVRDDSTVRTKDGFQGLHNGEPFRGTLKTFVNGKKSFVISPLTTLLANGTDSAEIIDFLHQEGFVGLSVDDLLEDPMRNIPEIGYVTDQDLMLLRSAMSVNAIFDLYDNYDMSPVELSANRARFSDLVSVVKETVSVDSFNRMVTENANVLDILGQEITLEYAVAAAVKITDTVVDHLQADSTLDPLYEANALLVYASDLALQYFVKDNRGDALIESAIAAGDLPDVQADVIIEISEEGEIISSGPGAIGIAVDAYTAAEQGGLLDVVLNRSGGSDGIVTVDWRTVGVSATFDQDYISSSWTTLTFADGETSKVVSVEIIDDLEVENNEIFELRLANPTGGSVLDEIAVASVTIVDNDVSVSGPDPVPDPVPVPDPTPAVFYGYDKSAGAADDPFAAPYGGTPRYVDPVYGANGGSGSINSPWADLEYALKNASAGDTIYLRGGIHDYDLIVNGGVDATSNNPIEVRSYPGEWAIIDGLNTSNGNLFRLFNVSWIIFRNFEVRNSDTSRVSNGFYVENVSDCEFHNIYMHDNNGAGFSAEELYRCSFYNCTANNNVDTQTSGDSADGFSITSGADNSFYRCVAIGNSDDGNDNWAAFNTYYEDCIAAYNGSGSGGDGNGFKLGKPDASPYIDSRGGGHTLVRCIALNNRFRGFSENATNNGSSFDQCIGFNNSQNWELPRAQHQVAKSVSFAGGGDSIGSLTAVNNSLGQGFGGIVVESDFESVDLADMNATQNGSRFFVPVSAALEAILY